MIPSHSIRASLCAVVLSLSSSVLSADLALSGTVLGTDGKPLYGVVVSLAQAKKTTTTDAAGAWSLSSTPAAIRTAQAVPTGSGRLVLEDGRLAVRFAGRDLAGRGQGVLPMVSGHRDLAARTTQSQDTLLYSMGNKVRLRDTVSSSQVGIVRILDTSINPAIIYGYLRDARDGQTYRTVRIGSQVWMAQNLNFRNTSGENDTVGACYDSDIANCATYGRSYRWAEAMKISSSYNSTSWDGSDVMHQGICPSGWHVPSDAEWIKLTDSTLSPGTAGTQLKAQSLWSINLGTDTYGFSILPAGYRDLYGSFFNLGEDAYLWSASEEAPYDACIRYANVRNTTLNSGYDKPLGFSLRCLQD
jgi:uncharacterized protein (TIGR02145 family)